MSFKSNERVNEGDRSSNNSPSRAVGVEEMMSQLDTMFKDDKSNSDGEENEMKGEPDDEFFIKLKEADISLKRTNSILE